MINIDGLVQEYVTPLLHCVGVISCTNPSIWYSFMQAISFIWLWYKIKVFSAAVGDS